MGFDIGRWWVFSVLLFWGLMPGFFAFADFLPGLVEESERESVCVFCSK